MFKICIADLCIPVDNKYEYIKEQSAQYIAKDEDVDFCVSVSDEEISAEDDGKSDYDRGYLESLAIYRKIADEIINYDGFLMHGVVLDVKGSGIAFLGKSGVGKTTHAKMWLELLGDDVRVINGDKPLVRIIDNKAYAYGTPWAGKENMHTNTKCVLENLCFIEQADKNECFEINKMEALERLIKQIYIPKKAQLLKKTFDKVNVLLSSTKAYVIKCKKDIDAAKTAHKQIQL